MLPVVTDLKETNKVTNFWLSPLQLPRANSSESSAYTMEIPYFSKTAGKFGIWDQRA
jgi:hypothetical protein